MESNKICEIGKKRPFDGSFFGPLSKKRKINFDKYEHLFKISDKFTVYELLSNHINRGTGRFDNTYDISDVTPLAIVLLSGSKYNHLILDIIENDPKLITRKDNYNNTLLHYACAYYYNGNNIVDPKNLFTIFDCMESNKLDIFVEDANKNTIYYPILLGNNSKLLDYVMDIMICQDKHILANLIVKYMRTICSRGSIENFKVFISYLDRLHNDFVVEEHVIENVAMSLCQSAISNNSYSNPKLNYEKLFYLLTYDNGKYETLLEMTNCNGDTLIRQIFYRVDKMINGKLTHNEERFLNYMMLINNILSDGSTQLLPFNKCSEKTMALEYLLRCVDLINKSAFEGFIENNNRAYFYLNYPELCENTKI